MINVLEGCTKGHPNVLFVDDLHHLLKSGHDDLLDSMLKRGMTVIASTTRIDLLDMEIQERFQNRWEFVPYTFDEMFVFVRDVFRRRGMAPAWQASEYVAARSLGLPRRAIEMVGDTVDVALFNGRADVYEPDAIEACRLMGVDSLGLIETHRRYLLGLLDAGEVGCELRVLATRLGQNVRVVEEHVEPVLIRLGLVAVDRRRMLTEAGHKHLAAEGLL